MAEETRMLRDFQVRLAVIDASQAAIQNVSQIVQAAPLATKLKLVGAWGATFGSGADARLKPLLYVGNDIVQHCPRTEDGQLLKFAMVMQIAHGFTTLHQRQPRLLVESFRVLEIWKRREIVDTKTAEFLETALQGKNIDLPLEQHLSELCLISIVPVPGGNDGAVPPNANNALAAKRKTQPLVADMEEVDRTYAEKLRRAAGPLTEFNKQLYDLSQFSRRLEGAPGEASGSVGGEAPKLRILRKKEWELQARKSYMLAEAFLCLDARHRVLVERAAALAESLEVLKLVKFRGGGTAHYLHNRDPMDVSG